MNNSIFQSQSIKTGLTMFINFFVQKIYTNSELMKYFFCVILFCFSISLKASVNSDTIIYENKNKQKTFKIKPSVTFTNVHLWRGFAAGNAPCIEPNIDWNYKNFTLTTWASYAIDNSYKEIDFILNYSWNFLSITLSDYYCPQANSVEKFTNFKTEETDHIFEVGTDITISEKIPVTISGAVFFAGQDIEKTENGIKQRYSTYLAVSYPFSISNVSLLAEIAATPNKGMYANEAKVFNYGLTVFKDLKINTFVLPTKYKFVYNLEQNAFHFAVALTIK